MSEKWDGGPAFPTPEIETHDTYRPPTEGMSLRDYFAGMAMQGMLANPNVDFSIDSSVVHAAYAKHSYMVANAMLKARKTLKSQEA